MPPGCFAPPASHQSAASAVARQSIAGSLRSWVHINPPKFQDVDAFAGDDHLFNLDRGLKIIENRAESLNRFIQAYRQLAQLPPPALQPVSLHPLVERAVLLETRVAVQLKPGPDVVLQLDSDQIEQLIINLLFQGSGDWQSLPIVLFCTLREPSCLHETLTLRMNLKASSWRRLKVAVTKTPVRSYAQHCEHWSARKGSLKRNSWPCAQQLMMAMPVGLPRAIRLDGFGRNFSFRRRGDRPRFLGDGTGRI